jgi:hypothetical protein
MGTACLDAPESKAVAKARGTQEINPKTGLKNSDKASGTLFPLLANSASYIRHSDSDIVDDIQYI